MNRSVIKCLAARVDRTTDIMDDDFRHPFDMPRRLMVRASVTTVMYVDAEFRSHCFTLEPGQECPDFEIDPRGMVIEIGPTGDAIVSCGPHGCQYIVPPAQVGRTAR